MGTRTPLFLVIHSGDKFAVPKGVNQRALFCSVGALVDLDLVVQMEPHNVVALSSRGDTKRMLHDTGAKHVLRRFLSWLFVAKVEFYLFFNTFFSFKACEGFVSERSNYSKLCCYVFPIQGWIP